MGLSVEQLSLPLAPGVAEELVDVRRRVDEACNPGDPPVGLGELVADLFTDRPRERRSNWLARESGVAVAVATAGVDVEGENVGFSEVAVDVLPDRVATGVERAVIAAALPWLREAGATTLSWWPFDERCRPVAESCGMTFRQLERCSRLRVVDVDDSQQAEWMTAETARAAGYRLVSWRGPCPDELLEPYAVAYTAMADAPLDEVEWNPTTYTPEIVRRWEVLHAELGREVFSSLALSAEGEAAGMTALIVHPDRPQLGHQEDTAVVATHRGFSLGRWLKSANLRQVRDDVPELEVVETFNAESNPWMLAINVDMGFRPHRAYFAHQGGVEEVARAVG